MKPVFVGFETWLKFIKFGLRFDMEGNKKDTLFLTLSWFLKFKRMSPVY